MTGDRISDALSRRPSDERDYNEPLRLPRSGEPGFAEPLTTLLPSLGVGTGHPTIRSRTPIRALPALVLIGLIAIGAGVASLGLPHAASGPSSPPTVQTLELTGRVACFGQGPGWTPTPGGPLNDCPNMAVPPDGYGAATWALDPAFGFSSDSTEVHVLVTEWACHGDTSAAGRIAQNVQYSGDRVVVTLAVRTLPGLQTCPAPPPTPFVLRLDHPVGSRTLFDGGPYPVVAIASAGRAIVTPSPSPYPVSWHSPMDCSSDVNVAGFFKAAAMITAFDVYCPVLPDGWSVVSDNEDQLSGVSSATYVTITYKGPSGEKLTIQQGDFCSKPAHSCALTDPSGSGRFGDREGALGGKPEAGLYLVVNPTGSPSWLASATGMSLVEFETLTAGMIVVGK